MPLCVEHHGDTVDLGTIEIGHLDRRLSRSGGRRARGHYRILLSRVTASCLDFTCNFR